MDSWWDLGEWSGSDGEKLTVHDIVCPFCSERGNFTVEHHAEKKKAQGRKILNFDTLKCGDCASYVMVMWSASTFGRMHGKIIMPRSLKIEKYPDFWPDTVGRYWLQAKSNIKSENWDAAALMARSSLQAALRDQEASGRNLKQEIDDLADKGVLPNIIKEWAHNVRELGNESAHPAADQEATNPQDAKDIVKFMDFLFEYLYALPKQINQYRDRKNS
tara:strand:- start:921 stop:1574 length:654 start_codon:yes stop_codon:yes gene_type:complete